MDQLQVWVTLKRWNRMLRLSVPLPVLGLVLLGALAVPVLTIVLGQVYVNRHTRVAELRRLVDENYRLKDQLAGYAAALDTFRRFLTITEQMDNRLRAATDLYLIPPEMRLLGVGGSLPDGITDIDQLLTRVKFDRNSLAEVENKLGDRASELDHIPSIWPVQGWVTSSFGRRRDPFTGSREMHQGIDIVAPSGAPISAAADGRVVYSGWRAGWGRCVEVNHGNGLITFYAHCQSLLANVGDQVRRGKTIARVGSSGRATGVHLHYGVLKNGSWTDPANYIID
jgi:murein DD-endopeptidase MepM/ murein hydrolase activator NlpD